MNCVSFVYEYPQWAKEPNTPRVNTCCAVIILAKSLVYMPAELDTWHVAHSWHDLPCAAKDIDPFELPLLGCTIACGKESVHGLKRPTCHPRQQAAPLIAEVHTARGRETAKTVVAVELVVYTAHAAGSAPASPSSVSH